VPGLKVLRLGTDLQENDGVAAGWFARHACLAAVVRPDRYVYGVASSSGTLAALLEEVAMRLR
jgi:3-(3-hydroxy-phenyl)propionate hydroxylase